MDSLLSFFFFLVVCCFISGSLWIFLFYDSDLNGSSKTFHVFVSFLTLLFCFWCDGSWLSSWSSHFLLISHHLSLSLFLSPSLKFEPQITDVNVSNVQHNPQFFVLCHLFLLSSSSSMSDLLLHLRVSTEFERNGRLEGSRWGYLGPRLRTTRLHPFKSSLSLSCSSAVSHLPCSSFLLLLLHCLEIFASSSAKFELFQMNPKKRTRSVKFQLCFVTVFALTCVVATQFAWGSVYSETAWHVCFLIIIFIHIHL